MTSFEILGSAHLLAAEGQRQIAASLARAVKGLFARIGRIFSGPAPARRSAPQR